MSTGRRRKKEEEMERGRDRDRVMEVETNRLIEREKREREREFEGERFFSSFLKSEKSSCVRGHQHLGRQYAMGKHFVIFEAFFLRIEAAIYV